MIDKLETILNQIYGDSLWKDEPMCGHTTFRIGGPAAFLVKPETVSQLKHTIAACVQCEVPYYIIGNGSNLLVSDAGYEGVVIQIFQTMDTISVDGDCIRVGAGALLSKVANVAKEASLTGLEFASGIPGTIGGALVMNAGAYGGEMKDVTQSVTMLTPSGEVVTRSGEEMQFGYRHSVAMDENLIILEAVLKLQEGTKDAIVAEMNRLATARKEKQPLEYPSAGSTFKRPEGYFAGKLIDDAGLRGYQYGGARVSDKHCGFVVNMGGATADDVMQLITHVQQEVASKFQVEIEPEVKFLGTF